MRGWGSPGGQLGGGGDLRKEAGGGLCSHLTVSSLRPTVLHCPPAPFTGWGRPASSAPPPLPVGEPSRCGGEGGVTGAGRPHPRAGRWLEPRGRRRVQALDTTTALSGAGGGWSAGRKADRAWLRRGAAPRLGRSPQAARLLGGGHATCSGEPGPFCAAGYCPSQVASLCLSYSGSVHRGSRSSHCLGSRTRGPCRGACERRHPQRHHLRRRLQPGPCTCSQACGTGRACGLPDRCVLKRLVSGGPGRGPRELGSEPCQQSPRPVWGARGSPCASDVSQETAAAGQGSFSSQP